MSCPRCQHDNFAGQKFCGECGAPVGFTDPSGPALSYTDLHHALSEALDQRKATAEILQVISSSPGDVQPAFDAIVSSAVKLCGGLFSSAFRSDGQLLRRDPARFRRDHGLCGSPLRRRSWLYLRGRGGTARADRALAEFPRGLGGATRSLPATRGQDEPDGPRRREGESRPRAGHRRPWRSDGAGGSCRRV